MEIGLVSPSRALPGGVVNIDISGRLDPTSTKVFLGDERADIVAVSSCRVTIIIPEGADDSLEVRCEGKRASGSLTVGRLIASDLHAVGNPVVDPTGGVYVTFSGSRGEQVPYSIFVIDESGEKQPFLADIVNPTGMALGPDGCLYITSRHNGSTYKSTLDKRVEKYAEGLGLATGLVFDSSGNLFVGDRRGTVYQVSKDRIVSAYCKLEPSISAYHLAMSPEDELFVSGPTLATQDRIYRIGKDAIPSVVFRGLGRPQGLTFGPDGRLRVAASLGGRKGVFSLSDGVMTHEIAAPMLVGLAYNFDGTKLMLVTNSSLFELPN
jgi:sugar lactone lactonase YvrE